MRVLVVPSDARAAGPLEEALTRRGHDVFHARAPWPRASKRREIALAADIARRALTGGFDAAYVEGTHRTSAVTAALYAARVPYVLAMASAPLGDATSRALAKPRLPITVEACRQAVRLSMRGAASTIAWDRSVAEHLAEQTGVTNAQIAEAPLDLGRLPLGARAEARAALGLRDEIRYVALVADLADDLPYELLLYAHRAVAGTGLLVAGDGPGMERIHAMALATRPSSPVIAVGPKTDGTMVALTCAADVCLSLGLRRAAPEARGYAALGRRQVLFDVPDAASLAALYPTLDTVFAAAPTADALTEALRCALAEERASGPLPYWAIEAARRALGRSRFDVLAERIEACA